MSAPPIRNIGIIAHIDAGKTTTTERMLFYSGKKHRIGEVDEGTTTMDWMLQEQNRGITITAAAITFPWQETQINLIDTPGHIDFTAEVERSLRVLDGAVVIFCAVGGVEPQSETVWHQANNYHIPRIVYINKMDRIGADYQKTVEEIEEKLRVIPVPLQIPIGSEAHFSGVIDLIRKQELHWKGERGEQVIAEAISKENKEQTEQWRETMIEALGNNDEEVAEYYLTGKEIPLELLQSSIRRLTLQRKIVPVLTGSSLKNIGVHRLLDAVVDYLPAPEEREEIKIHHIKDEKSRHLIRNINETTMGLVFKIQNDREAGILSFVRMFSGKITTTSRIFIPGRKNPERITRIFRIHANKTERISALEAGDLGAIVGFKQIRTGNTITTAPSHYVLEPIRFATPVISISVETENLPDRDKLQKILAILTTEDPTLTFREDSESGQIILSGMGELHLNVLITRILDDFSLPVRTGTPQVALRETITTEVQSTQEFQQIIAGKEQHASITLQMRPQQPGEGNRIIFSHDQELEIPDLILQIITDSIETSLYSGIKFGYPSLDVEVCIQHIGYDPQHSGEPAIRSVTSQCCQQLFDTAASVVLEPIMKIHLFSPPSFLGDVISGLISRKGSVQGISSRTEVESIIAEAPLRQMFGYSTALRSSTQGRGSYSMEFSHYAPLTDKS